MTHPEDMLATDKSAEQLQLIYDYAVKHGHEELKEQVKKMAENFNVPLKEPHT